MQVLVANTRMRRGLDPLPEGVQLVAEPGPGVEMLVVSHEFEVRLAGIVGAAPDLKVVQALSAGVDWLLPLVPEGVVVCRAVGVHDVSVAEWVVAAILAMRRRLPEFLEFQRHAEWNRSLGESDAIDDLDGTTMLVVGHGAIGRALGARMHPFGVRTVGVAQHARDDAQLVSALTSLLPRADVVVDLLPLSPQTVHFVDATFLAQMKEGALFVNAGRGRTVDTGALLAALRAGRIRAALDVTDPEPLPSDHALWSAPNLLITPHVAGSVRREQERAYRFVGEQIRRYVAGEPLVGVFARG